VSDVPHHRAAPTRPTGADESRPPVFLEKACSHSFAACVTLSLSPLCVVHLPSSILSFTCIIALTCCGNLAREVPTNYVLLLLFTLSEGYLVGSVASYYTAESVAIAVAMTAIITLGLTLYAFQVRMTVLCTHGAPSRLARSVVPPVNAW
jgi:hypothetical protein